MIMMRFLDQPSMYFSAWSG